MCHMDDYDYDDDDEDDDDDDNDDDGCWWGHLVINSSDK